LIMIKVADEAIQRNYLKENIIIIIIISKFVKRHVCLQNCRGAEIAWISESLHLVTE